MSLERFCVAIGTSNLEALNSFKLARPSHVYVQMGANEFSFNFTVLFVAK